MPLPGQDPAIGGGRIAVINAGAIQILSAADLTLVGTVPAPGADAVAISRKWVVWRAHVRDRDFMRARKLADPAAPGPQVSLGSAGRRAQLGRPSVDGSRLVYARAQQTENLIVRRQLGKRTGDAKSTVLRSRVLGLSNPSLHGDRLLYILGTRRGDRLKIKSVGGKGHGRTLLSPPTRPALVDGPRSEARLRDRDLRHGPATEDRLGPAVVLRRLPCGRGSPRRPPANRRAEARAQRSPGAPVSLSGSRWRAPRRARSETSDRPCRG